MSTTTSFRIDVNVHNLLMNSDTDGPQIPVAQGLTLPEPVYPRFPEKLSDPGPATPPDRREWTMSQAYRSMEGWLFPYIRSRVLPGSSTRSLPTCSRHINATSTAGTAGHSTTK